MTIENDFLPFSTGGGAYVISQATYAAAGWVASGFSNGIADASQANKVWRQSSIMAAVIADLIVAQTAQPAIDDGTTSTLLANLTQSIANIALNNNQTRIISGVSGSYTLTTAQCGASAIVTGIASIQFPAKAAGLYYGIVCFGGSSSATLSTPDATPIYVGSTYASTLGMPAGATALFLCNGSDWIALDYSGFANTQSPGDNSTNTATTAFVQTAVAGAAQLAYPIGSVYFSANSTNPATSLGFGTWSQVGQGRVIVGVGTGTDINSVTATFPAGNDSVGEYVHTLSTTEIPAHSHTTPYGTGNVIAGSGTPAVFPGAGGTLSSNNTGGGGTHNNVQPSFGLYIWKRTA
jgi:hypothetical protein